LNVQIVTDGNSTSGFGHLRRSATLSWKLKHCGHKVCVVKASTDHDQVMPKVPMDDGHPDLIVIDLPDDGDSWIDRDKYPTTKYLGLDYSGSIPPDAIVSIIDRHKSPKCLNRFSGLKYAIIREDVLKISSKIDGKGIVVCIGGSDQLKIGAQISSLLANEFKDVTLIEGPMVQLPLEQSDKFQVFQNPDDFAHRIARCSWAVTNGGSLMMEMMCMGKAVHVIPQTPQEEELANFVYSQGGILGVGNKDLTPPDTDHMQRVSQNAQKLVDGLGLDRIVNIIESLH
jgi:spore coat polysaccharide biosynthesis predicted glycosyltransferase SpsG